MTEISLRQLQSQSARLVKRREQYKNLAAEFLVSGAGKCSVLLANDRKQFRIWRISAPVA
jgi:hypothetical protein